MKKRYIIILLTLVTGTISCNYLDVDPVGKVIPESTSEYRALLTSAYNSFPRHKKLLTLRSDEVFPTLFTPTYTSNLDLALLIDNGRNPATASYPWQLLYKVAFYANSVIEEVQNSVVDTQDPSDSPRQLKGEALLLRAYVHFELLNLYAKPYDKETASTERGIPLALEVDINKEYFPATVEKVYEQILADIEEAFTFLQVDEQPAATRYRFSRKSALALEARVRLYRSEWELALNAAEKLLPSCPLENLNDAGFKAPYRYDSKESILALELTGGVDISDDTYVLSNLTDKYDERDLRLALYFKYSFGTYLPDKCEDKSMRVTFRSGEIYLVAAEAAVYTNGKLDLAKLYLKQLIINRLVPAYYDEKVAEIDAMTEQELIHEIMEERARELALEGHRWYDLRRTDRPEIRKTYLDANFEEQEVVVKQNDSRYVIPFPKEAIESNPNLNN